MKDHLSEKDLKRYRDREMGGAELLAADDHLAGCDVCFAALGGTADVPPLEKFADEDPHLTYERLEALVDGTADDVEREIADVHLETCPPCAAEFRALADLRESLASGHAPEPSPGLADRLRQILAGRLVPAFAAAAAVVVLVLGGIWLARRGPAGGTTVAEMPGPSPAPIAENRNADSSVTEPEIVQTNVNTGANTATGPFDGLPEQLRAEAERAVADGRLRIPTEVSGLRSRTGQLMGNGDSVPFALVGPVGKIVESDRPRFAWQPLPDAEAYIVEIYDENFNNVAKSEKITATGWQPDRPLRRGQTYVWQVTAIRGGEEIKSPVRPAPDARVRILDGRQAAEIGRYRREFPKEHLALGIVYARAGLVEEAAAEFRKELSRNPASREARRFLAELQRIR